MKTQILSGLAICILLISCIKKYKFTSKLNDTNLFVEVYNVNPFGVNADYLTDSINFRKYIGDWDEEHEEYLYNCKGDSIYIKKIVSGNRWAKWDTAANGMISLKCNLDTIQNLTFSLSKLKMLDNFR